MNIFETHSRIVSDYASYISSFIKISDPKIREVVEGELSQGKLWPEPLLQFNPAFEIAGGIDLLAESEGFHPDLRHIFSEYKLYRHQILRRLLALNHERAKVEQAATISSTNSRKQRSKKKAKGAPEDLFFREENLQSPD
jgi:hypothetical protein